MTIGLGIIFIYYCFLSKLRKTGNKLELPPGPRPWPLIGNLHLLGDLPHQALRTLAKRYGPILFLHLGSIPTAVVSSPTMAKEFLKTHDLIISTRATFAYGKYICHDHKGVAFSFYGEYWRQMRKLMTVELLTVKRIDSFKFVREEEVSAMVASIWHQSRKGKQYLDIKKRQNIICRMFASRIYSDNKLNRGLSFKQMVEEIFAIAGAFCVGDFIPSLDWLDLQGFYCRMKAVHKVFNGFVENVLDDHIHRRLETGKPEEEDGVKDMVDIMLSMTETISRTDMKAMMLDMLNVGMETSVTLMEWAMSELLRSLAALARAQKETELVVRRERRVTESDITRLDYLRCFVKETLRLHPPVPLLVQRESMEGCSVGGHLVLAKTRLFVDAWAMGRDESIWRDAHEFRPERFIENNKDVRVQDFDFLPFGAGRRGCPGVYMGLSISELALAQLLHFIDWTADSKADLTKVFRLTVPRKYPLLVRRSWRLIVECPV